MQKQNKRKKTKVNPHPSILVGRRRRRRRRRQKGSHVRPAKVATLRRSDLLQRRSAVINLAARCLTSPPASFPGNWVYHYVHFDVFFSCLVFAVGMDSRRFAHFRSFVVVFVLKFGLFLWLIVTWYGGRKHGSMLLCWQCFFFVLCFDRW